MRYISLVLFIVTCVASCKPPAEGSQENELPVRTVRTEVAQTGDVVTTARLVGELEGIQEVQVFPQVAERIRSLTVREGSEVSKNEVLATLNADLQSESVNQAQAAVEASIANRDALLDNLNRTRELAKAGSVPVSQLQSLEAQTRAAEAQVRQASAALGQASAQRGRAVLRAPIAGVVAKVNVKEGDMANPAQPVMTIVRDERVKAVFRVPEREFLQMTPGMQVTVQPLASPSVSVTGEITLKGPIVDRATKTGLIEVHLENTDGTLMAGTSVRGTVELGRRSNVVLVPAEAVLLTHETEATGRALVFTTDGATATRRDVVVGARQGGALEITEGLAAGETVVVQGAHFLRDGSPLRIAGEQEKPVATTEETPQ